MNHFEHQEPGDSNSECTDNTAAAGDGLPHPDRRTVVVYVVQTNPQKERCVGREEPHELAV